MRIVIISIALSISSVVLSQDLQLLNYSEGERSSFEFAGIEMYTEGNIHRTMSEFTSPIMGSGMNDFVTIDSLIISNIDFTSALLQLYFRSCSKPDEYSEPGENAYFVSIGFFDSDSVYVFGHSFVSDGGFSLDGVHLDLQATPLNVRLIDRECFAYIGLEKLAIHQAFLYAPNETTGGVRKIKFVSVEVSHLGAG